MSRATSRVFVPLTTEALRRLESDGALEVHAAYAVTPGLRAVLPGADEEDLEYAALCDAADACADTDRTRRIVAAADVPGDLAPADGAAVESLVRMGVPLALPDVVSLHVGEPGASDDEELSWYDVSELALVLSLP